MNNARRTRYYPCPGVGDGTVGEGWQTPGVKYGPLDFKSRIPLSASVVFDAPCTTIIENTAMRPTKSGKFFIRVIERHAFC